MSDALRHDVSLTVTRPEAPELRNTRGARALRKLQRLYSRNRPWLYLALPGLLVAVVAFLDIVGWTHGEVERLASRHDVTVGMLDHLLVTALLAGFAYYLLFGRKMQAALRRYRKIPVYDLVAWAEKRPAVVRGSRTKDFADEITRSFDPAVGIVHGRTGTGRTNFIVGLTKELADKKLVPVPVRAKRGEPFTFGEDAERIFEKRIDVKLGSKDQGEAIWRRVRRSRLTVVIVDGIDDDVAERFWEDDGAQLRQTVRDLVECRVAVVFATTRRLPLDGLVTIREDLDRFTLDEALKFLRRNKNIDAAKRDEAVAALEKLHDPVNDALVAPFYLELIEGLRGPLGVLPANRDLWRAAMLARYFAALGFGQVTPLRGHGVHRRAERERQGREALSAIDALACALDVENGALTADTGSLQGAGARQVKHAVDFGLLWCSGTRVGFAADDLAAYAIARAETSHARLIKAVRRVAKAEEESGRQDRYPVMALLFWASRHTGPPRDEMFEELVDLIAVGGWKRPAVVAAAIRIATICDIHSRDDQLRRDAERCIKHVETIHPEDSAAWRRDELTKLVRALADWRHIPAQFVLLRLASSTSTGLDWPAAKALAMASGHPDAALQRLIQKRLDRADAAEKTSLARHDSRLGNQLAALAWVLPALRDVYPDEFSHANRLCLAEVMSPLRGEVALAQGIKHAVLNGRCCEDNAKDAAYYIGHHRTDGRPYIRSWHARILLVHALLAHHWRSEGTDPTALLGLLADVQKEEKHPLVWRAIERAREGVEARSRSAGTPELDSEVGRDSYMWTHEREAVSWVGRGRNDLAQLAADVVLLVNMGYELRERHPEEADRAATQTELPRCLRDASQRHRINEGGVCGCGQRLCGEPKDPAKDWRAPFQESFCRQQVRLARKHGTPQWINGRRQALAEFWETQAAEMARGHRHA